MQPLRLRRRACDGSARSTLGEAILLIVGIAFVLAGCTVPSLGSTSATATPTVGAPSDVPLPKGSTFAATGHSDQIGAQVWIYTAANTNAQQVEAYYRNALPQQGWIDYQADFASATGGQSVSITAQKSEVGEALTIMAEPGPVGSVTVTSGGVILQITLLPAGV